MPAFGFVGAAGDQGRNGRGGEPGNADAAGVAAAELARLFANLAGQLAPLVPRRQVRYGPGRLGGVFRRRSPAGFVLDPVTLQMLLPDGRLWSYSEEDLRFPAGRLFDVRTDHINFARNRSFFGGIGFIFLGAVVGKYSFGLTDQESGRPRRGRHWGVDPGESRLCALSGDAHSLSYLDADEALSDIAQQVVNRAAGADRATATRFGINSV